MKRSVIEQARNLMKRRKFGIVVRLLESESYARKYKGSFEYYLALGTSCLYLDDDGDAARYYDEARKIHINSSELLLGQAALFLRRGDNAKAIQYYLDVLDMDPGNQMAKGAMEFIRTKGRDFLEVQRIKSNGKIQKYYPPLGTNPDIIRNLVLVGIAAAAVLALVLVFMPKSSEKWNGERGNLSDIALTGKERRDAVTENPSANKVHYILSNEAAVKSIENAVMYWHAHRDNPARVEINRILNSNATDTIKGKAKQLQGRLSKVTFETFREKGKENDNYPYSEVESDHVLYDGCYVAWTGTIANPTEESDGSWRCVLFVGYHEGLHLEGTVDVVFRPENRSPINPERPIRILGVVGEKNGKIVLDGRAVYQPVKGVFD